MRTVSQDSARALAPVFRALVVTIAVLASAGAWFWWSQFEQRALLSLPSGERLRLYERNLESMRVLCGDANRTAAFEKRCRDQAQFLAEFPECDAGCRTFIEPHLPRPSR